jgi:hypothetical protein
MKLITKQLEKRFNQIGTQENSRNPLVIAKFFNPCISMVWYATEYETDTRICFGYVAGTQFPEWGYFSIDELEALKVPPFDLPIERDMYFTEKRFSQLEL